MKYKIFVLTTFLVSFMSFGQIGGAEEVPSWETVGVANKLVGYPKLEKTKVGDPKIVKSYYFPEADMTFFISKPLKQVLMWKIGKVDSL